MMLTAGTLKDTYLRVVSADKMDLARAEISQMKLDMVPWSMIHCKLVTRGPRQNILVVPTHWTTQVLERMVGGMCVVAYTSENSAHSQCSRIPREVKRAQN